MKTAHQIAGTVLIALAVSDSVNLTSVALLLMGCVNIWMSSDYENTR